MEEVDRESIFTRLFGGYNYDSTINKYKFDLKDNDSFTCQNINSISDASYDSTFKKLFAENGAENRLSDLLNSILFPNDEDNINQLTYLNDEFHKIDAKHNKGMLKTDVACKIETNEGYNYIVCIEMQIAKDKRFTKRLFNYGTILRNNNLYENCFVIGLCINSEKGTNKINLKRKEGSEQTTLKYIKIIEINIRQELDNIKNNKPVEINGKIIKNKGKEYIKLLGIRKWGKKDGKKYIIPDTSLITTNNVLKKCFDILGSITQSEIDLMELDEQSYIDMMNQKEEEGIKKGIEQGIEQGIQQGILKSAYTLFANGNEEQVEILFQNNNIILDVNEDEIRDMLEGNISEVIEVFIQYLKVHNYLP